MKQKVENSYLSNPENKKWNNKWPANEREVQPLFSQRLFICPDDLIADYLLRCKTMLLKFIFPAETIKCQKWTPKNLNKSIEYLKMFNKSHISLRENGKK